MWSGLIKKSGSPVVTTNKVSSKESIELSLFVNPPLTETPSSSDKASLFPPYFQPSQAQYIPYFRNTAAIQSEKGEPDLHSIQIRPDQLFADASKDECKNLHDIELFNLLAEQVCAALQVFEVYGQLPNREDGQDLMVLAINKIPELDEKTSSVISLRPLFPWSYKEVEYRFLPTKKPRFDIKKQTLESQILKINLMQRFLESLKIYALNGPNNFLVGLNDYEWLSKAAEASLAIENQQLEENNGDRSIYRTDSDIKYDQRKQERVLKKKEERKAYWAAKINAVFNVIKWPFKAIATAVKSVPQLLVSIQSALISFIKIQK